MALPLETIFPGQTFAAPDCPLDDQFLDAVEADVAEAKLRLEDPPPDPWMPEARNLPPSQRPPEPAPPRRKIPRATRQQLRERLAQVRAFLVQGMTTHQISLFAEATWKIKKRRVQMLVKLVKGRLADEASRADYLAHLQLSQLQADEVFAGLRAQMNAAVDDPKLYCALAGKALQAQKYRDGVMASIQEHRAAVHRDQSPDAEAARAKRADRISMPLDEFWERWQNCKQMHRKLWEDHYAELLDIPLAHVKLLYEQWQAEGKRVPTVKQMLTPYLSVAEPIKVKHLGEWWDEYKHHHARLN